MDTSATHAFPAGLPARIDGPSAWLGPAMAACQDWRVTLTAADLVEIAAATEPWLADDADIAQLRSATQFPLPGLAPRLAGWLAELQHGRGFVLLRGLPVAQWGRRRSAVALYGLGAHLGRSRSQNAQGHVLGHVKDLGLSSSDPRVRIYQTHERQTFHTDSCDIVGLLCLHPAKTGGLSALVSSVTLYNTLRAGWPELAAALFQPLATDRRGEIPPGCGAYFEIPVFNWFDGHFSAIYQRQYIDSAQRLAGAPRLSAAQIRALDQLDALANDTALHFTMALAPGDIQFVHNHSLFHDRTAFEDWAEPQRRRHLLRLWLAPQQAQALPPVYAQRYGSVVPGERGGVVLQGVALNAPLAQ